MATRAVAVGVVLAAALSCLLTSWSVAPAAHAAGPETYYADNDAFAFTGHGYGHGRGMSQNGAYGAALEGLSSAQILDFYYPGSVPAPTPAANAGIRVLLSGGDGVQTQLSVQTRDGAVTLTDYGTATALALPAAVGAAPVTGWRLVAVGNGTIRLEGAWSGAWQAYPVGAGFVTAGAAGFGGAAGQLTVVRADGTLRDYAGTIAAAPNGATGISTINLLSTEAYLRGVVPSESPSSWPPAALQAQTVAARTYAVRVSDPTRLYDICDTTSCQVYSGLATYMADGRLSRATTTNNTDGAITATAGQIRTYGGAPILAQYSASDGGWTVSGGPSAPYLVAKPDPYDGAIPNSSNSWTQTISASTLGAAVGVGRAYALVVTSRDGNGDWGGRVGGVTVLGSTGSVALSGDVFRSKTGMKSNWWTAPAGTLAGSQPRSGVGSRDLFSIALNNTGSQSVEVHALARSTNYATFDQHSATAFGTVAAADWQFFVAPYGGDGQPDLYGVKLRDTASGKVEVHVLSAASGYQSFLLHVATAQPQLPVGASVDVALGSYNRDGQQDLYVIPWANTGSAKVEVHVLTAASTYQAFAVHVATALPTSSIAAGEWQFLVGDAPGQGDLFAVHAAGSTGSGRTEVHVLSQTSGYQTWTVHVATALGLLTPGDFWLGLEDFDADGTPDLFAVLRGASTGSRMTEVHVLSGAGGYTSFADHAATALAPSPAATWQFGIG